VRIVSLVPSVTETLVAWGTPRSPAPGSASSLGSTTWVAPRPAIERIVALAPDVVVMDEEENRIEDYRSLLGAGVGVEALAVRAIADVGPALVRLAALAGTEPPDDTGGPGRRPADRLRAFSSIWRGRGWRSGSRLRCLAARRPGCRHRPGANACVCEHRARTVAAGPSRRGARTERAVPVHVSAAPRARVGPHRPSSWTARTSSGGRAHRGGACAPGRARGLDP